MPLGIYSPCILKKENLGPKPTFFGHRGAPMVGLSKVSMGRCRCWGHGMEKGALEASETLERKEGLDMTRIRG